MSGCGSDKRILSIKPPPQLLTCADEPLAPPSPVTDAANAEFIIAALEAGEDCRSKVRATAVWAGELP